MLSKARNLPSKLTNSLKGFLGYKLTSRATTSFFDRDHLGVFHAHGKRVYSSSPRAYTDSSLDGSLPKPSKNHILFISSLENQFSPNKLLINNWQIDEELVILLIEYMKKNSVKGFDFRNSQFNEAGLDIFLGYLAENKTLETFSIANCDFSKNFELLIKFLSNSKIKIATFDSCKFGDKLDTIDSITYDSSLESLSIFYSEITGVMSNFIVSLLKNNRNLRALNFIFYSITNDIFLDISKALGNSNKIETFSLLLASGAKLDKDTLSLALNYIESNSSLTSLNLPLEPNFDGQRIKKFIGQNFIIKDTILECAKVILGTKLSRAIINFPNIISDAVDLYEYEEDLLRLTKRILLDGFSNQRIKELSQSYNSLFFKVRTSRLKNFGNMTWPSLIGPNVVDVPFEVTGIRDCQMVALTNPEQLKKAGDDLNHCAAGATSLCFSQSYHVLAVMVSGVLKATLLVYAQEGNISKSDYAAFNDSSPRDGLEKIPEWFEKEYQKKIDFDFLEVKRQERLSRELKFIDQATAYIGFDPREDDKFLQLLQIYYRLGPLWAKSNFKKLANCQDEIYVESFYEKYPIALALPPSRKKEEEYKLRPLEDVVRSEAENKKKFIVAAVVINKSLDKIYGADIITIKQKNNGLFFNFKEGFGNLKQSLCEILSFQKDVTFKYDKSGGLLVQKINVVKLMNHLKKVAAEKSPPPEISANDFKALILTTKRESR